MNTVKPLLIIIIIFFASILYGQEEDYSSLFDDEDSGTGEVEEESDKGKFDFDFYGEHSFDYFLPLDKNSFDFEGPLAPGLLNSFGLEIKTDKIKIISDWELSLILSRGASWDNILIARPLENLIEISAGKLKFGIGYQYISWGTADEVNPTDNLNPKDYRRILSGEKIPLFSAQFSIYPVDFLSIDFVYAPFEQNDLFPVEIADKIPDTVFGSGKNVVREELSFSPKSMITGGKINFYFPVIDFSFSYLYDIDPQYTPVILLDTSTSPDTIDSIRLKRLRIHRIGFDLKASVKDFGIWLESCYSITEDPTASSYKIRNSHFDWTAGFDYSKEKFYTNIQTTGRWIQNFDNSFYSDYPGGYPEAGNANNRTYMEKYYYRLFARNMETEGLNIGLLARFKWTLLDSMLEPSLSAGYFLPFLYDRDYDKKYGSLFLNPEIEIEPLESFSIVLGANLYYAWHKEKGSDRISLNYNDRIGQFKTDSSIYLSLKYNWNISRE